MYPPLVYGMRVPVTRPSRATPWHPSSSTISDTAAGPAKMYTDPDSPARRSRMPRIRAGDSSQHDELRDLLEAEFSCGNEPRNQASAAAPHTPVIELKPQAGNPDPIGFRRPLLHRDVSLAGGTSRESRAAAGAPVIRARPIASIGPSTVPWRQSIRAVACRRRRTLIHAMERFFSSPRPSCRTCPAVKKR